MKKILMSFFLLVGVILALLADPPAGNPAPAAEPAKSSLVVYDAIAGGDLPAREALLDFADSNRRIEIVIHSASTDDALRALDAGEADLVLAHEDAVPESYRLRRRYAAETAVVVVNAGNGRDHFSVAELRSIFSGTLGDWQSLNGSAYSLHRYGLTDGMPGERLFRSAVMRNRPYASELFRRRGTSELLLLAAASPNAIAFCGYCADMPAGVRTAAVDGVFPTVENLRDGRYPLMSYRVVLMGKRVSPQALRFIRRLNSAEFAGQLRRSGFFAN